METTIKLLGVTMAVGDLATWVTGIVTIFLFFATLKQISNERNIRVKNEKELLQKEKIKQAELVSTWVADNVINTNGEPETWIAISNLSLQPIYQVIVIIAPLNPKGDDLMFRNASVTACISIAPPGLGYSRIVFLADRLLGVELAFKEVKGTCWLRKANGEISELNMPTYEHYEFQLPLSWERLYPEITKHSTSTAFG